MNILVHDFAGHPFQVQLSRSLAASGHRVVHAFPVGLEGPKGNLSASPDDAPNFKLLGIPLSSTFRKYSAWRRFVAHRSYASDLCRLVGGQNFDVVISGNTPIDIQAEFLWFCRGREIGFIHWVQDVYCKALEFVLKHKLPSLAKKLAWPFAKIEQWVSRSSTSCIVICEGFESQLLRWGVPQGKITTIKNWAPLNEVTVAARDNEWAVKHELVDRTVFLYSGTLGMKHRPDLLYKLAAALPGTCELVVITRGIGRDYLEKQPKLGNLTLLGFQPYGELSNVLASADVLLATLENGAGEFAVPSKVLSCMCAGKPILMAAPVQNLAASIIADSNAGVVVSPDDEQQWIQAALELAGNPALRASLGENARRYAVENFDIESITSRFEEMLNKACIEHAPAVPAVVQDVPDQI